MPSGVRERFEELEQRWFPDLDRVLAHLGGGPTLSREVKQVVMERLFTASPGVRPRIHAYTGTGDLRGWLKVTCVRTAVSLLRKVKREVPLEEALLDERRADSDPELALLKGTYRAEFEHAFRAAVATLDPRDRNVLRYQVLEGLSIDEVGSLYGVHRATVARWAQGAKDQLVSETKRELRKRLQVDASELDSIIRLIQSRLDISLGGLLGAPSAKK